MLFSLRRILRINSTSSSCFLLFQPLTYHIGSSRLFSHWTYAFSRLFGCTQPKPLPPSTTGWLSLAYVHKFMDLNYTEVGHFIEQLTLSSKYFGFSDQDALTLNTQMNAQYNVRCAPPVTFNAQLGPQLYSLCQDNSCPLAQPVADCQAYENIAPTMAQNSVTSTGVAHSTSAFSIISSSSASTTPMTFYAATSSSDTLSAGAIAGVAVGGAAVFLGFIALIIFFLRRRQTPKAEKAPDATSNPPYYSQPYTDNHASYMSDHTSPTAQTEQWVQVLQEAPSIVPAELDGSDSGLRSPNVGSPKMEARSVYPYLSPVNTARV